MTTTSAGPTTSLVPLARPVLEGSECLAGVGASVLDFWRFAMSDLQVTTVRGLFAEFLVQQAVGASGAREEWASHDVTAPDGTTIEVKASAALQAWTQTRASSILFSGLRGRAWTAAGHAPTATYNAQVYVFAVQTSTAHEDYDPLDVSQWRFCVLPRSVVADRGCDSMALSTVQHLSGGPVTFGELATAIRTAAAADRV